MIGAGGIERVVEITLNRAEKAMFDKSVEAVRGLVDACKASTPPSPDRRPRPLAASYRRRITRPPTSLLPAARQLVITAFCM